MSYNKLVLTVLYSDTLISMLETVDGCSYTSFIIHNNYLSTFNSINFRSKSHNGVVSYKSCTFQIQDRSKMFTDL